MKKFEGIEAIGACIIAAIDGMGGFRSTAVKILIENGLEEPQMDKWYSFDDWVNTLNMIVKKVGPSTMFQVGRKISATAVIPPQIDSVEKILSSLSQAYKMNARGANLNIIGDYAYTKIDNKSAKIVCNTPFPCDFDRGIVDGFANKFKAPGQVVKVTHDPAECRNNSGEKCTYMVTW